MCYLRPPSFRGGVRLTISDLNLFIFDCPPGTIVQNRLPPSHPSPSRKSKNSKSDQD